MAERCRSPRFRGGAFFPGAATVQPARLALGLRDRVASLPNVRVFEQSRLRRLTAGSWGCVAETSAATVRARSCALALGSASNAAGSPFRNRLTVTSSHMAITEPVPDVLEEAGWTGESASPTAGRCSTTCARPPTGASPSAGAAAASPAAPASAASPSSTAGSSTRSLPTCALLPGARGPLDRPRLGRADRRLAHPPAGGHAGRLGLRLRRLRLHRQRRRALPPGGRGARLAGARPPRRAHEPGPGRARPRRASRPGCPAGPAATRSAPACWPRRPPRRRSGSRPPSHRGLASIPERIGFHIGR